MHSPSCWGKARRSPTTSNRFSLSTLMQRRTPVQLSILTTLTFHPLLSLIGPTPALTLSYLATNRTHLIRFHPAPDVLLVGHRSVAAEPEVKCMMVPSKNRNVGVARNLGITGAVVRSLLILLRMTRKHEHMYDVCLTFRVIYVSLEP